MIRCSVVVPACGRPAMLERLLEALVRQDLPPDEYEVIVSDQVASEETRAQVSRWAICHAVPIRYVAGTLPRRGRAAARNAGWRVAEGDIVAFTDEDTVPQRDWLRQGLAALGDGADAACGRLVVPASESAEAGGNQRHADHPVTPGSFMANCFCRRWALACVGGSEPRVRTPWREDRALLVRLMENGLEVVFASDAVVVYPVRPQSWDASFLAAVLIPFLSIYWRVRGWVAFRADSP